MSEQSKPWAMANRRPYIPCLRWKQGEYQAVLRLSSNARAAIVPLIEAPEIGYDFEMMTEAKSIDEHLAPFARRIREKWGREECFVDLHHVGNSTRMVTGQNALTFAFDDLRKEGVAAIPVITVAEVIEVPATIRKIVAEDARGLAIRIGIEDAASPRLMATIDTMMENCRASVQQCRLLIDIGAPNFDPIDGFVSILESVLKNLPYLERWHTLALIGTSFPPSMAILKPGANILSRSEWRLYKALAGRLRQSGVRVPCFGDYAVHHPNIIGADMRFVKPYASVRYTIDDNWLIVRGENVRDSGYKQFRELCGVVLQSAEYRGANFSRGDEYIYKCAKGFASTGTLTTWRWVGTNHHLETVTRDVASFGVS